MTVAEIIALVISGVTLVILIYQSLVLKWTIGNQIWESFVSNSLEIDRLLIENPQFRKYIYDGAEVTDDTEDLDKLMSIVELVMDITENIEVYTKYIPAARRKGWMQFVEDTKKTPAYHYYVRKYGKWYEVE